MRGYGRLFAIAFVFGCTCIGWLVLGGVTKMREETQSSKLRSSVQSLWGNPQTQSAPVLTFHYDTEQLVTRTETRPDAKDGQEVKIQELVATHHADPVALSGSNLVVRLASDLRKKGLTWYSLYDVELTADYGYVHRVERDGELEVALAFPDTSAIYDDFSFVVDGVDRSGGLESGGNVVRARTRVAAGQSVQIRVHYKSRGLDQWQYQPAHGVDKLESFSLHMHTDFTDIDFPAGTLSPSRKVRDGDGYELHWDFKQIVTGNGIGMVMPSRIQPGALAAELALSAPVSLFFFFFVVFVLATLRSIDIHPLNYLLLAGAFFAFHLLFAYSVDHLPIEAAFALSSAVSVCLVVSYLRLVVSARFAFGYAGLAQLVYLVGFSLAHFWEGYTGLTATVLAVVTLFAVMQLTGRVRWSEVLAAPTGSGAIKSA